MTYYTQEEFKNEMIKAFKSEEFNDYWAKKERSRLGYKLTSRGNSMVLSIYYDKKKKELLEEFIVSLVEVEEEEDFGLCDTFNVNTKSGDKHIQWEMDYGNTRSCVEILKGIMYYFYSRY